jgi:hypothetical protein
VIWKVWENARRSAGLRGKRDLDVPPRGRADLVDLRAILHGYRRPGRDRV